MASEKPIRARRVGDDDTPDAVGWPSWLMLVACVVVALAAGAAGGFILGDMNGRKSNARELAEAKQVAEAVARDIGGVKAERDQLAARLAEALNAARAEQPKPQPAAAQNNPGQKEPAQPPAKDAFREAAVAYFAAPYEERHRWVEDGDKHHEKMRSYYSRLPPRPAIAPSAVGVEGVQRVGKDRAIVSATFSNERYPVYMSSRSGRWLVDWPSTVGWNEPPLKVLDSTAPGGNHRIRVRASLDSYYNFDFSDTQELNYSFRFEDVQRETLHGYARKDSDVGRRLHELLKDGSTREVTVTVRLVRAGQGVSSIVSFDRVDWFDE